MAGIGESPISADTKEQTFTPPWVVWQKKGKAEKEGWFKTIIDPLMRLSQDRVERYVNNLLWYTGEYDQTMEYRLIIPGRGAEPVPRRILPRIFSHLSDITEQRVSRLSRYKPSFDVEPANEQEKDRRNRIIMKKCLGKIARRERLDFKMQAIERWNAVMGEVMVEVHFDKWAGDAMAPGSSKRMGDVVFNIKSPWTYFPDPKNQWEKVKWCIDIQDIVHFEEARVIFNNNKIEADGMTTIFPFSPTNTKEKRPDEVIVFRLIQLPSQFSEKGVVSYFINKQLVFEEEWTDFDFPFTRHTDIDIPERLFPMSFYQWLIPVQHVYNRLTSIMVRNILYTGHPHILNPRGSGAKRESFGNAPTEITFTPVGGFRPEIMTFKSIPQEMFQFRDGVRGELNQISGIQGVSRGAPPPGVRAASMLRFFAEQEEQRASTNIIKHNELIRRLYQKAAAIIGKEYPKNPSRIVRILGPEYAYLTDSLSNSDLSSEYDIIIVNSTGFSEDMSGRLEEVALISQLEKESGSQLLSPEEKADVLQLRNPQKAYDIATSALRTAELHLEYFRAGIPVPDPEPFWDLIVHWRETSIFMNSPEWQELAQETQDAVKIHMKTMERLMLDKKSPSFLAQVEALRGFPLLYHPEEEIPQEPMPGPEQPGAKGPNGITQIFGAVPQMATSGEPSLPAVPLVPAPPVNGGMA